MGQASKRINSSREIILNGLDHQSLWQNISNNIAHQRTEIVEKLSLATKAIEEQGWSFMLLESQSNSLQRKQQSAVRIKPPSTDNLEF